MIERQIRDILSRLERLEKPDAGGVIVAYTPTYVGGTSAGVTTYSQQVGYYIRSGKSIIAQGYVSWTGATGTGQARLSLPFTAAAGSFRYTAVTLWVFNVTFAHGTPQGLLFPSTDYVTMWSPRTNNTSVQIDVETAGEIAFLATYMID